MTIGKRITCIAAALLTLTTAVAAVSLWNLSSLNRTLDFMVSDPIPGMLRIAQLRTTLGSIRLRMIWHATATDPTRKATLHRELLGLREDFSRVYVEYGRTVTSAEDRDLYSRAGADYLQMNRAFDAHDDYEGKVDPLAASIAKLLDDIVDLNGRNANQSAQLAIQSASSGRNLILMLMLLCLLTGGGLSWWVIHGVNATLSLVSKTMREGSRQVAGASQEISSASQTLARGASQQAASIEEISASMEEMTAMTKRNSENSEEAKSTIEETVSRVEKSNLALDDMVASMAAIQASSEKVAKINKTIDEIAFQTNILALNAAVEAARAGEAGMGFAVVANEVRNLAQRSAEAAKDTSALIEEAIANSHLGASKLEQVSSRIRGISEIASRVKTLVGEVNEASKQQSLGITQVSSAIHQLNHATQSAAAGAQESAAASEELSAQARSVDGLVNQLEALVH